MTISGLFHATLASISAVTIAAPAIAAPLAAAPAKAPGAAPAALPADRTQVEAIIKTYLLDHPEIIPEAMQRLEERQRSERIAALRTQIEKPFEGAWTGNPDGDVVVVEFFDYACGYCRRMAGDVARLVKEDPEVKVVFREFPILGQGSVEAAKIALQAARSGSYQQFHHELFAAEGLSKKTLETAAKNAKVKMPKDLSAVNAEISANHKLARQLGINGTPAFIIGGRFASGAIGYDSLKEQVAAARKAMAATAPPTPKE